MTARAPAVGEDRQALTRFVFGLTLGVGAMVALAGALTAQPSVAVAVPTAVLAVGLWTWRGDGLPHPVAGWAGAVVWLVLATLTHDDTVLVPLAMAATCASVAIGPDRVLAWLRAQWMRDESAEAPSRPAEPAGEPGWLEEEGRRL
ncbi:MAG TPA: hypothetical protein VFM03_00950 [Candidatus Limnocylindria bacterium]|nr:hypothetical protein [Candidatus Limnocylindria bacterium]